MEKKERNFYGVTIVNGVIWDYQCYEKLYTRCELASIRNAIDNTLREYEKRGFTEEHIASYNEKSKQDECNSYSESYSRKKQPKIDNTDLYLISNRDKGTLKIGKSKNVKVRLKQLQIASSDSLTLIATIQRKGYMESEVHRMFEKLLVRGEWFKYDNSIIEYFEKLSDEV